MSRSTTLDCSVQICASRQDPCSCLLGPTALSPSPVFLLHRQKNNYMFAGCLHHFFQEQESPSPFLRHHQPSLMFLLPLNTCQLPTSFRDAEKSNVPPPHCPFAIGTGPEIFIFPTKIPFRRIFDQEFKTTLKRSILFSLDLLISWRRGVCR